MATAKIKVLLVDDHPVVRTGFRYLLEKQNGFHVDEVGSAEDAYTSYASLQPDVVILDISMPGMGGLEGIKRLRARDASACILVLSMYDDLGFVTRARKMGAMGYLSKNGAPEELARAIRSVLAGKEYYSADIAAELENQHHSVCEVQGLSTREFQVFRLLAEGRTAQAIADDLNLSPKTVNNHRTHIMEKLGLKNASELTRFAIRQGVIKA